MAAPPPKRTNSPFPSSSQAASYPPNGALQLTTAFDQSRLATGRWSSVAAVLMPSSFQALPKLRGARSSRATT